VKRSTFCPDFSSPARAAALSLFVICNPGCKDERAAPARKAANSAAPAVSRLELEMPVPMAPTVRPPGARPNLAAERAGVGDTANTADYKMTLLAVKECKVETYFRPKAGNIKLAVEIAIEGNRDVDVPVSPFHARITDSESHEYSSTLAGCTPILPSVRVAKGERADGWITFELPEKATGLNLTYDPVIIGGTRQSLVFSLGR